MNMSKEKMHEHPVYFDPYANIFPLPLGVERIC